MTEDEKRENTSASGLSLDAAEPCRCGSGKSAKECCLPILIAARQISQKARRRSATIASEQPYISAAIFPHVNAYIELLERGIQNSDDGAQSKQTYPGNPLGLTRDQHIIGRRHIEMFSAGYKVQALLFHGPKVVIQHHSAKNSRFCAHRVWSQNAERWMRSTIEEPFYAAMLESLRSGVVAEQEVITDYWALCCARSAVSASPPSDSDLAGFQREPLTDAARDALDYAGMGYYSEQGDLARTIVDLAIVALMDRLILRFVVPNRVKWGVVDVEESSLVLPDFFGTLDVPITPNSLLHGHTNSDVLPERQQIPTGPTLDAHIDRMVARARRFVVAASRAPLERLRKRLP